MRWAGYGSHLWRVRVDLFAERRAPERRQISTVADRLRAVLKETDGDARTDRGFCGVDSGTGGIGDRNVIGMTFWVRAGANLNLVSWRSLVDVDLNGQWDPPGLTESPYQNLNCSPS